MRKYLSTFLNTLLRGPVFVYWWRPMNWSKGDVENYGDWLSAYLIEHLTKRLVIRVDYPKRTLWLKLSHTIAIGSILKCGSTKSKVWGSGLISADERVSVRPHNILALRGIYTARELSKRGFDIDPNDMTYGDPATLLPLVLPNNTQITHKFGIVVNYSEWELVQHINHPSIKVINLHTNDIEQTTAEILSCKYIFSSSLHGLIIPHAYYNWAIGVKISDLLHGDGIKFDDYFSSACKWSNTGVPMQLLDGRYIANSRLSMTKLLSSLNAVLATMSCAYDKQLSEHNPTAENIYYTQKRLLLTMPFSISAKRSAELNNKIYTNKLKNNRC